MKSVALGAAIVLLAIDARADDTIQLEDEPVQQQQLQPPPSFTPPATLEEYRLRLSERKQALRYAKEDQDGAAIARIQADIHQIDGWYRANTHVNSSGMFIGGIAMAGLGVAGLVAGLTMIFVGANVGCIICTRPSSSSDLITGGIVVTATGIVVGLSGIPLAIIGHRRVIGPPEISLFLGPTSGIQGTF